MTESAQQFLGEWTRWARLGWFDILSRYRRTTFGPFWIVILTGMTVGAIGFVYGSLFRLPIRDFIPYVAIGLITWTWISTSLIEAGTAFAAYKFILLNQELHPTSIVVRVVLRNWIILLHNAVVIVVLFAAFARPLSWMIFLVIPGMLMVGAIVFVTAIVMAFCCTRYRDLNQVLSAAMGLGFLITPVIWSPDVLAERAYIATLNPFTHLLDLIRLPLLGTAPAVHSWLVAGGVFLGLLIAATVSVRKYRYQVPFWV